MEVEVIKYGLDVIGHMQGRLSYNLEVSTSIAP